MFDDWIDFFHYFTIVNSKFYFTIFTAVSDNVCCRLVSLVLSSLKLITFRGSCTVKNTFFIMFYYLKRQINCIVLFSAKLWRIFLHLAITLRYAVTKIDVALKVRNQFQNSLHHCKAWKILFLLIPNTHNSSVVKSFQNNKVCLSRFTLLSYFSRRGKTTSRRGNAPPWLRHCSRYSVIWS